VELGGLEPLSQSASELRELGHAHAAITLKVYAHLFDAARHAANARERLEADYGMVLTPYVAYTTILGHPEVMVKKCRFVGPAGSARGESGERIAAAAAHEPVDDRGSTTISPSVIGRRASIRLATSQMRSFSS
jgi:hypothetical protein